MTNSITVSGDVHKRGTYAVSSERTLKDILLNEAGGMKAFKQLKMIQVGGPLGRCLSGNEMNHPLSSFEQSMMAPSIYYFNDLLCPVDYLRFITRYMIREVKHDTKRIRDINGYIENIAQGKGNGTDLEFVKMLLKTETETLADDLFNSVFESIIEKFETEITEHIIEKKCRNGICRAMIMSQCINACPAGIHIPGYVELMKRDSYPEAYALMRQDNPLSFICGKVCARPCEARCRRKEIESTVGVRALQKFASGMALDTTELNEDKLPLKNKRIAIVGAGPCGLTSAYYLARTGYDVTIYEAENHVGGMLAFGVPAYRLPYDDILKEVRTIEKLGVTIKTETRIGKDLSFEDLKDSHDAVLLATGSHVGNRLPGYDHSNIETAAAFLRSVRLEQRNKIGRRVLVVGGGDVAIDTARTALRLGAEKVSVVALESFENMPASVEERVQAQEEKIDFLNGWGIEKIHCDSTLHVGLTKCVAVIDDEGHFNPTYDQNQKYACDVESLIFAIGQKPNLDYLNQDVEQDRGFVTVNKRTFETTMPKVFAAGDVTKPSIAIEAIANGKKAALSIDRFLGGDGLYTGATITIPETVLSVTTWDDSLVEEKMSSPEERVRGFEEINLGYTTAEAKIEASRCMRCDRNSQQPLLLTPKR